MPKKIIKMVFLLSIILLTTGCWDAISVEDRDICTAVVVDKEDDGYAYYVEIASVTSKIENPQSEQGKQGQETIIVKGSGKDFLKARMDIDKELNKPVYLGAVQALIMTEKMADSGIEEYAYRIRQMQEYRKTMDVLITPDEPEEFLKIQPENAETVGFAIEYTLENLRLRGQTPHMSLADLLQKLVSSNSSYLMLTLSIQKEQITLTGYTVFDGGKRVGFIPYDQSRGIVYLANNSSTDPVFEYAVPLKNGEIALRTTLEKIKTTPTYDGNQVNFNIDLSYVGKVLYSSNKDPVTDEMIHEAEEKHKEQLMEDIVETIDISQKQYKLDYLSFSEPFRIKYPDVFESMDWKKEFKNAKFNINIDLKVREPEAIDYNPEGKG